MPAVSYGRGPRPLCLALYFRDPEGNAASSVRLSHFLRGMTKAGWDVALACSPGHGFQGQGLQSWYPVKLPLFGGNGRGGPAGAGGPADAGWWSSSGPREALRRVTGPLKPWIPFPDKAWWLGRLGGLERWGARLAPDLIYSSSPPPTMHLAAARLARRLGVPWVAELRDLWSDNFFERKRGVLGLLDRRVEGAVLGRADGLVTVSPPLAETLRARYRLPVEVIYASFNGDRPPAPAGRAEAPPPGLPLRVLYAGRVYPGLMMPDMLLKAVQGLLESGALRPGELAVDFFCHNHRYLRGWLEERFPGTAGCCRVRAPIAHREMLALQPRYHALLHIGWFDHNFQGCVTSKFFEYLGASRPILSTSKPGSLTGDILRRTGAGRAVTTPGECAGLLLDWVQGLRAGIAPAPARGAAELLREFSLDQQATRLSRFLLGFVK